MLTNWAKAHGLKEKSLWKIAKKKFLEDLLNHEFYSFKIANGVSYPIKGDNPIKQTYPLYSYDG